MLKNMLASDVLPPFSVAEYERRFKLVRDGLSEKGLDCLIIYGGVSWNGTDPGFVHASYLSNVVTIVNNYVVFPLKGDPTVITISHGAWVKKTTAIDDTRLVSNLPEGVVQRVKELGLQRGRIGIVGPCAGFGADIDMPWSHRDLLIRELSGAKFEDVTWWFSDLTSQRSEEEIKYLERAAKVADIAAYAVIEAIRPGIRLSEIYAIVSEVAATHRVQNSGFNMGKSSTTVPVPMEAEWIPSHTTVDRGDFVAFAPTVSYGGYMARNHLTIFVGEPSQEYINLIAAAGRVNERIVNELKPGMTGADVVKMLEPLLNDGFTTWGPAIIGLNRMITHPVLGELGESLLQTQADLAFVFKPGMVFSVGPAILPRYKGLEGKAKGRKGMTANSLAYKRLMIGGSCCLTETGVRRLCTYPTWEKAIVV